MPARITRTFIFTCVWCGSSKELRDTTHNRRKRFCNPSCSAKWRMSCDDIKRRIYENPERLRKISEATKKQMQNEELRKKHSQRMKEHNPMYSEEIRQKVKQILKERHPLGTKVRRGGNGRGMTKYEAVLKQHFPFLEWNYAVSLGKRQKGYPTNYKIDLAYVEKKIGIEVDGKSHRPLSRQDQDRKKEAKLAELGWVIVRFTNQQIEENLNAVIECLSKLFQQK